MTKNVMLLQPFEGYDVNIGPATLRGFRLVSEWNGLMELRNEAGDGLILNKEENDFSTYAKVFSIIFGNGMKVSLVKASPGIMNLIAAQLKEKLDGTGHLEPGQG